MSPRQEIVHLLRVNGCDNSHRLHKTAEQGPQSSAADATNRGGEPFPEPVPTGVPRCRMACNKCRIA